MKTQTYLSKLGLIGYWALLPWCMSAQSQDPYTGIWEGNFMEQFKTVILLDEQEDAAYNGKILMYSGENRIQDDQLSRISIKDRTISFYIAAKETSFLGNFNETNTEFSGAFTFPDNSKHPLIVRKYEKDSLAPETAGPSLKERLKKSFPAEELKSDLRELINKLKELHPRLYSHTSEASFEKMAAEILESLDSDLGMEEFYFRIAPLVASVGCSHTGIRIPQQYQQGIQQSGLFFPMDLHVQGSRAYYLSAPGLPEMKLEPGCEITSINGRSMDQIIRELLGLIPAEGQNMSRKYQELNRDFQSYLHLKDPADRFVIEYSSSGSTGNIEVDAVPYSQVNSKGIVELSNRPYSFEVRSGKGLDFPMPR